MIFSFSDKDTYGTKDAQFKTETLLTMSKQQLQPILDAVANSITTFILKTSMILKFHG